LRFSKSGDSSIEEAYATHYVVVPKLGEEKDIHKAVKNENQT